MALISKEIKIEKTDFRVRIDQNIKAEIDAYCNWAGIEDINHFFSEAVKIILAKDKDWHKYRLDSK